MKKFFRIALLMLGLAALFECAPRAQASLTVTVVVTNGPNPVAGAMGYWTFTGPNPQSGVFTTGANGMATLVYTVGAVNGTMTAYVTNMPGGLVLANSGVTTGPLNLPANTYIATFGYSVASGQLSGQVSSENRALGGATITGSVSGVLGTVAGNGLFVFNGPAQTLTPSKTGVTFSPASAFQYPGGYSSFSVVSGPFSGTVSGPGGSGGYIFLVDAYFSAFTPVYPGSGGNYTSAAYNAIAGDPWTITRIRQLVITLRRQPPLPIWCPANPG